MPNDAEVLRAFKSMHQILRDGRILVLTQGSTDKWWREKPRFVPGVNQRDFTRVFVVDYLERGARFNILDIFHSAEAHDFKVWSIDYPYIPLKDDQDRLLRTSGFRLVDFYGTFRFDQYDKESSNRLIAVAQK